MTECGQAVRAGEIGELRANLQCTAAADPLHLSARGVLVGRAATLNLNGFTIAGDGTGVGVECAGCTVNGPGEIRTFIEPSGRTTMNSRLLMTLQVVVEGAQKIGAVPHGTRATVPIAGGRFEGPRLRGRVVPGGGDWTLLRTDGVLELDLRLTLETDDGALIHMTSFGLRHGPAEVIAALGRGERVDPSAYYFRTTPRFETAHPKYSFVNRLLAVSSGDRRAEGPIYTIDELL